jgi:hypothetical protein
MPGVSRCGGATKHESPAMHSKSPWDEVSQPASSNAANTRLCATEADTAEFAKRSRMVFIQDKEVMVCRQSNLPAT